MDWELAGLTDDETGALERPLGYERWELPGYVDVFGDRLVWARGAPANYVSAGPGMLQEFVSLADGSPEKTRDFARKWGVLQLCLHNLPASHDPVLVAANGRRGCPLVRLKLGVDDLPLDIDPEKLKVPLQVTFRRQPPSGWYCEPLSEWRRLARKASAVLNLAAALFKGREMEHEEWLASSTRSREELVANLNLPEEWLAAGARPPAELVANLFHPDVPLSMYNTTTDDERILSQILNDWLAVGDVRPRIAGWFVSAPRIALAGGGLYGALGTQLLFAVARSDGLAICTACGSAYTPERKPAAGRRNYCRMCRGHADKRDASRAYRRRKSRAPEGE